MFDVLIGLALVALGFYFGRRSVPPRAQPPAVEETELLRLQEDRTAFSQLMGYNAERAYGNGE
ncbi:MAG: hypothetical protein J6J43_06565 [Oscillospiraceae bacterium]|nr:hypothetical protein [Oscillospiraceae bacterium]